MHVFAKKLMPAGDLVHRPPLHSSSCRGTVVTGSIVSAAALVFIYIYARENGTIIRSTISDNACSEGFTVKQNCKDVSHYPLIVQAKLHDFLQAEMLFTRRPESEEELHEAMGAMACVAQQLGDDVVYHDLQAFVLELPEGLPYICSSPDHPWVEITLVGQSPSSSFKTFIRTFELEAERLPPPPDPAWEFQVAGGAVGKSLAETLAQSFVALVGVPPERSIAYAGLAYRMNNSIILWWTLFWDCTADTMAASEVYRECQRGAPFYDSEGLLSDPDCVTNFSPDVGAYLNQTTYDIIGSEGFNVDEEVGDFDGMMAHTCSNFTKPLGDHLYRWEVYLYSQNARDISVLIQAAIDDVLRMCPFQVICDTPELTLSNMVTVAFPFLSGLSKVLGLAMPIIYGLWLKCMIRKSAAGLAAEAAKDMISDELKLLVDQEIRKAMAQFKDELGLLLRTGEVQAPAPHEGEASTASSAAALLKEAPPQLEATVTRVTDAQPVVAKGGDGDRSLWRKELDDLQKRVAAAESKLDNLREVFSAEGAAILRDFSKLLESDSGSGKASSSVTFGGTAAITRRAPSTGAPRWGAASSARGSATKSRSAPSGVPASGSTFTTKSPADKALEGNATDPTAWV